MRFLRIIHIYLLIGALAGCFFSIPKLATTILPFCIYVGLTAYLLFLFFKQSPNLLFNSLVFLFIIQLISIKTMVFGYLLSIGFCFFIGFGFEPNAARETLLGFSSSDFSPVTEGQNQIVGINVLAVVILLLLILTKEK